MRKFLKKNILEIFQTMYEAHNDIKKLIEKKDLESVNVILGDCQNTAVQIGTAIEGSEGEGFVSVKYLEEYCEAVYQVASEISEFTGSRAQKALDKKLIKAENSVKNDIKVILEVVFLPYKASMWDSLESIWKAADADPDCNAHVIPIPYYDKKPDGTFGEMHYEGADMPEYVPLMHYEAYNLELMRPDVIYIHNPYDNNNFVTSVDPRFYSDKLKECTECLVYVPYYSTSGGMSESRKYCSVYYKCDYIVIQAERYRSFFDEKLPNSKFLPLGTPKYDRVIKICNDRHDINAEWADLVGNRKVVFYNTSIGGMLSNTEAFLRKMQYVFDTFSKHPDVCVLWRPHPLLDSTFKSMRPQYFDWFTDLKNKFISNKLGIYDTTPDVTYSIASSDSYIGDAESSITSLFGIAGKPLFILRNNISRLPSENDWYSELANNFDPDNQSSIITRKNELYTISDSENSYRFAGKITKYNGGFYYKFFTVINKKIYVCPCNAQDVVVVTNTIKKTIKLEKKLERSRAFSGAISIGKYIFLIPDYYPALVRINTEDDSIKYIESAADFIMSNRNENFGCGGYCIHNGYLFIGLPSDSKVIAIEPETCNIQYIDVGGEKHSGCMNMQSVGKNIWIMPNDGLCVKCWNPDSGKLTEYCSFPDELYSMHPQYNAKCLYKPFSNVAFTQDHVYIAPHWANMFIKINIKNGSAEKWDPPFDYTDRFSEQYHSIPYKARFGNNNHSAGTADVFTGDEGRLYSVNINDNSYNYKKLEFNKNEVYQTEPGFGRYTDWLRYCCEESALNSLEDFITNNISGNAFNKSEQIKAFSENAANPDGTCGTKVHSFIKNKTIC